MQLPDASFSFSPASVSSKHNQITCSVVPVSGTAYYWNFGDSTKMETGTSVTHVIGVVPLAIINIGRKSSMCNDLIEVETISRRKDKMRELSDVFIVLPGGYGTLDEMFDVVTSAMDKCEFR